MSSVEIVYCFAVVVLAYTLRGGTGFGGVLVMPLLAVVVPMKVLVPAWSLLSVIAGAAILRREYQHIAWADFLRLMPTCMLGIAFGLYFYELFDSKALGRGLGALVVLYGALSLRSAMQPIPMWHMPPKSIGRLVGLIAGLVGTTFGALTSLSFAMYFDAIRMPMDQFRATMSASLVAMGVVRGFGYFVMGEYTGDVWLLLAMTLPPAAIGIYFGNRFYDELDERIFRPIVSLTLIVCGFVLMVK